MKPVKQLPGYIIVMELFGIVIIALTYAQLNGYLTLPALLNDKLNPILLICLGLLLIFPAGVFFLLTLFRQADAQWQRLQGDKKEKQSDE